MSDHREFMAALAAEKGWKRGIELGLGSGHLFRRFTSLGIEMIGVDLGRRPDRVAKVERVAKDAQPPAKLVWKSTQAAAALIPDAWADFVFVDAGHSYEACKADIAAYLPKVKAGGWFGGDDYHSAFPGVMQAVDEAFEGRAVVHDCFVWERPE